jgi:hypothetical protein
MDGLSSIEQRHQLQFLFDRMGLLVGMGTELDFRLAHTTGYYHAWDTSTGNYWYGDWNREVQARLHTHAFMALTTTTSPSSVPIEHVMSAFAY